MHSLYLTPASISYLNQFLLALLVTIYLAIRSRPLSHQHRTPHSYLIVVLFINVTIFSLLLYLEVSLLPTLRLIVLYGQDLVLSFIILTLLQFVYTFPTARQTQRLEYWLALLLGSAYALFELGLAGWRLFHLPQGQVIDQPGVMLAIPPLAFLWIIGVYLRNPRREEPRAENYHFAWIFTLPFILTILNSLNQVVPISPSLLSIAISVGMLFTIFFFVLTYWANLPNMTPLVTRLSGAILTSVMAIFSILPWLVTPAYASHYEPKLIDRRTLSFLPNERGGFTVVEQAFSFDDAYGEKLDIANGHLTQRDFTLPFYGQMVRHVMISDDGIIGMGAAATYRDLEFALLSAPAVIPLLVDLNPDTNPSGGVFVRQTDDRLVISYVQMHGVYHPDHVYTFQVVLYHAGRIDITYNGLPARYDFVANDRPHAVAWGIGVKPAQGQPSSVDFSQLPIVGGPEGMIQDEYSAFRYYIHQFLVPLAIALGLSTLFFFVVLPLTLNYSLMRPLALLLGGVRIFNNSNRGVNIPVRFNDEIGFLTRSFNKLSYELNSMISGLEAHVARRTADLVSANERLRKLSIAVEQSPSTIIITDLAARIEYVNAAFTRSTGYSFAEVRGQNPKLLKSDKTPPHIYAEMWAALLAGETWRGELYNRRKNGEEFWELTIIAPITNDAGNITHYVAVKEDLTARKLAEQELERLAMIDPLSGLYNRRYFFAEAEQLFTRSNQAPYALTAIMLDIDHFKHINDTYGHQTGDVVIQEVAKHLASHLRSIDLLGRYGGEEFVVLLPRTFFADSTQIVERLIHKIRTTPIVVEGVRLSVTMSAGVAHLSDGSRNLDDLLSHADQALYQAKLHGRDRWVLWEKEESMVMSRNQF